MAQRKLIWVLGAGMSQPAKIPSTREITDRVLSGEGVWKRGDDSYGIADGRLETDEHVQAIRGLISFVKAIVDEYYAATPARATNYEDLFYLISQINDSVTHEYDNPAIQPLMNIIDKQTNHLNFPTPYGKQSPWDMGELTREARNYIADICWILLSRKPAETAYLSILSDCIKSRSCEWIDMFTLNHDTLAEHSLVSNDIEVADGFERPINQVRYWNPDCYGNNHVKAVRLFKLHGSVNWFWFEDISYRRRLGIPTSNDIYHLLDPANQMLTPIDGRPEMLVGRFNKELAYTKQLYTDLHGYFHESLKEADRMIICGYSFGDKAINTRIISWLSDKADRDRRIVVIHPNPDKLSRQARPAITGKLQRWERDKLLVWILKGVEKTRWNEIREAMNAPL